MKKVRPVQQHNPAALGAVTFGVLLDKQTVTIIRPDRLSGMHKFLLSMTTGPTAPAWHVVESGATERLYFPKGNLREYGPDA